MNNDQPWPQDLQGRHVGCQDTESSGLRGHVHLLDVSTVEEDLEKTHGEQVTADQSHSIRTPQQ